MGKFRIDEILNKKVWEDFVLAQNPKSFLQSWNWGETNRLVGKKIFRYGIFKRNELVGVFLAIKEPAKRGPHLIIPGGPLMDWSSKEVVKVFLEKIKDLAEKEGVWFVRIRPELLDNDKNRKLFEKLGFVPAPMHLHAENTWILNISKSNEEILKGMRKTTRYMVRKSVKFPFTLELTVNPNSAKILKKLQDETVERHKFVGFPEKLFSSQLSSFGKDDQGRLFIVKLKGKVLVCAIIIFYGKVAYYHHSASSKYSLGTPASYFLQWQVILEAKKRGCNIYNFWGIAPTDDPKHRFAGVTLFKKGFGGERVDWLHAYDLITSPLYWITYIFETGRRIFRRL